MTDPDPEPVDMTSAFLEMAASLGPFLDFVDGQRAEFERRGYSPTAAEAMAVGLYMNGISSMFRAPVVVEHASRRGWWRR